MINILELFYPILTRRISYKKTQDGQYYSNYHEYYIEIEDDCQKRCVYCDISLDEMGGEGMQLDHFRPQNIPTFEQLKNDPNNLVLSCPKCNRFKSDHWTVNTIDNATYTEDCGFLDPFQENRLEYYTIERSGIITNKKPPAEYIIRLLKLDRISRTQVRRKRILEAEISFYASIIEKKIKTLMEMLDDDGISRTDIRQEVESLYEIFKMLKKML